jgi:hypothetical protein
VVKSTDIIDRLLRAADATDKLSQTDLQTLILQAAMEVKTLRERVSARTGEWSEDGSAKRPS